MTAVQPRQSAAEDILDALPRPAARLDANGRVVAVNHALDAWLQQVPGLDERLQGAWADPVQHVADGARTSSVEVDLGDHRVEIHAARSGASVLVIVDRERPRLRAEMDALRREARNGAEARAALHDMANLLTRATVAASLIDEYLSASRLPQLDKVAAILKHQDPSDPAHATALRYLEALCSELQGERALVAREAGNVIESITTVGKRLQERSRRCDPE